MPVTVRSDAREAYDEWSKTYDTDRNITRDLDAHVTQTAFGGLAFESILEFGCGTGKNSRFFARIAQRVMALDFSERMIAKANSSMQLENVTFRVADIRNSWPAKDASHDLISCNLILQHVDDLNFVFAEAKRCLEGGGRLFVSELHPIKKYQGSMARYENSGKPMAIHGFNHQISDFLAVAKRNDLKLVELDEWWHDEDWGKPPRLVTFVFEKSTCRD